MRIEDIYLGPYAEISSRYVDKEHDGCRRRGLGCPDDRMSPFCPECGLAKQERFKMISRREVQETVYDLVGDTLAGRSKNHGGLLVTWVLPNESRPGATKEFWKRFEDPEGAYDLVGIDMKIEMDWFKTAYENELAKIERAYGNLAIRWGIVVW